MPEVLERKELEDLQVALHDVQERLDRHRLDDPSSRLGDDADSGDRDRQVPGFEPSAQILELRAKLEELHAADIAYILEALPPDDRLFVWDLVKAERDGEILLELSDAVRESLIRSMDADELVAATEQLDTDEIADLAHDLPEEVIDDVFRALPVEEREQLRSAMSYAESSVGALMDFQVVSIREDVTLEVVSRYLRRFDELPDHTDQLFVVDREERLKGTLPIAKLIVAEPDVLVGQAMLTEAVTLYPDDEARDAAQAFERYDLVSAAVVDQAGKLIGRVTVASVVDFIRASSESEALAIGGLREGEDIFAPVRESLRNRWSWLAINLITAFIASRVISAFEGSIEKLVALATLMPIVAGIGGNSGNQTITMIVRGLALGQVQVEQAMKLFSKELKVALVNGLVWGTILGLIAYVLYPKAGVMLGVVMMVAMTLNLLLAASMGVMIPIAMTRLGRDPAIGSSVMVTAVTDSGGFFIFLGLATLAQHIGWFSSGATP
jgi:magnesium transporter